MIALPPFDAGFGVYVHWPFCAAKCPYCDFNSHVRRGGIDQAAFVQAYRREIDHWAELAPGRTVSSIFFGGGTPSLMEPRTVDAILEAIAAAWPVARDCEVTLEANPTSVEAERFRGYRAAGVNRVSLGVQSLNAADLAFLGRLHSVEEALAAVRLARETFERVSFDLIYARPGQSLADWRAELARALDHAPDHLSLYQLTIEPETPFDALERAGKLKVPDTEAARALYAETQEITARAGLPAYEISNHARPGAECRHNLLYWRYGEYAGIGAGAHGRVYGADGRVAIANEKLPEAWRDRVMSAGHGAIEQEALTAENEADEFLLMGLRLAEGIDPARFERLRGQPLRPEQIDELEKHGLIERTADGRLRGTREGFIVLDAVVADLAA
jgi:oxygen-independent coproporphyrinogen-3 oxidase